MVFFKTSTSSQNPIAASSDLGQGSASPVNPGMQPQCSVTPETHASTGERESPNARYERHLLAEGHGFPLWAPQPHSRLPLSYRRKGVSVGDVGIITQQGYFDFLFNICLPHGHTSNPEFLPIDFSPVILSPTDISELREHDPGSCLLTSSTAKLGGLNFKCNGPEGSILVMPNGAYHEDLLNMYKFQRAASQNAENWYRFAIGTCGRVIGNGELRLVTGCDKTSSWGIATYSDFPPEALKLAASGVQSPVKYTWDYEGRVEAKAWPKLDELLPVDAAGSQECPWNVRNQCTFLRSFTFTLADNVWKTMISTLIQDPSDNHILNSREPRSYFRSIISGSFFGFGGSGGSVNIRNHSLRSEKSPTHPATIINQMLLNQNPNAKVAISHDNDWCAVIRQDETTMPDASELLSRIQQTFMTHFNEDGTVYLTQEHPPGTNPQRQPLSSDTLVTVLEYGCADQWTLSNATSNTHNEDNGQLPSGAQSKQAEGRQNTEGGIVLDDEEFASRLLLEGRTPTQQFSRESTFSTPRTPPAVGSSLTPAMSSIQTSRAQGEGVLLNTLPYNQPRNIVISGGSPTVVPISSPTVVPRSSPTVVPISSPTVVPRSSPAVVPRNSMGKLKILAKPGRHSSQLTPASTSSPTPHLNQQLNETEATRVLQAISGAERDVGELVHQIKANPRDMGLRRRYIACVHFLEEHKGLLSPVRRLPNELLAQIFNFCATDLEPCWTVPPWMLAQVSRRWRAVALSLPEIWGVVPPIRLSMKEKRKKLIPLLKELLHRSGEHPLSLHISSDEDGVVNHAIFQLLISHCMRWGTVVMELDVSDMQTLTRYIRRRLSSLYSLKLVVRTPHEGDYVLEPFSIAPMLQEVEINCPRIHLFLPWEQLTRYTELSADPIGVAKIISMSSQINYFSYSTCAILDIQEHLRPTTLTNITTFHLNFYNPWISGTSILASLTLPALTDLHVQSSKGSLLEDLIALTLRSNCVLKKLSIHTLPSQGGLTRILHFTPFLTEFQCNDFITEDMERLRAIPGTPSLVPRLRKLVIQSDKPMKELNDMILSRHSGANNVALESLTLKFTSSVECFEAQCALERWDAVDKELAGVIGGWRADIEKRLIMWVTRSRSNSLHKAMMNVNQLGVDFRTLETYEFSHARYIYHSGIHNVMEEMSNMSAGALPRVEGYNFKARARALVDKWKPLLVSDLPKRHWMRRGLTTLEYIPDSSVLRHSEAGMLSIILGWIWVDLGSFETSSSVVGLVLVRTLFYPTYLLVIRISSYT